MAADAVGADVPSRQTARCAVVWRHPVRTVAVAALAAAAYQSWWLLTHRHTGGWGVDEAAYASIALRLERALSSDGLGAILRAFINSPRHAPLVPLLSVPFVALGGRSNAAVLLVQPVLYAALAVLVAALVSRTSRSAAALVAGVVTLGLPVLIADARSYQFALAPAVFLIAAVLAVVSSERGERRGQMIWFGLATGALLLSRTMTVAFLPALAVGWWVASSRTKRSWWNLLAAAGAALAVAAPWWIAQRRSVGAYLFSFGYGSGATQIEAVPLPLRLPVRLGFAMVEIRPLLVVPGVVVVTAAVVSAVRWRRANRRLAGWPAATRSHAVLLVGLVGLLSSSNMGAGFQVPLDVLGVALVASVGGTLAGRWERVAASVAVLAAIANIALVSTVRPFATVPNGSATMSLVAFAGTEEQQHQDFALDDARFQSANGWVRRSAAERAWATASTQVARAVAAVDGTNGPVVVTMIGETNLLNSATLGLLAERTPQRGQLYESPATPESLLNRTVNLDPFVDGVGPRVLVAVVPPGGRRSPSVAAADYLPRAVAQGWKVRRTLRLPAGAQAVVLTHPVNDAR
ncbi:MAG: ArnT family glycosyltransferase [Actinomycetes bacterium]